MASRSVHIYVSAKTLQVSLSVLYYFLLRINGALAGTKEFSAVIGSLSQQDEQVNEVYIKPYCRAAPYIIGLMLGFLLHKKFGSTSTILVHELADLLCYVGGVCRLLFLCSVWAP